ncbi:MAG: phosphomethylpyrimidine synthase ThiC, partial [Candidatus Deferrimicrobiaceae bacterium]
MTLLHNVRNGVLVPRVALAAAEEGIPAEKLRGLIASGKAVIPRNKKRKEIRPIAIGEGLTVKVNANVGSSRDRAD